jgi:hypothetical protein
MNYAYSFDRARQGKGTQAPSPCPAPPSPLIEVRNETETIILGGTLNWGTSASINKQQWASLGSYT